MENQKTILVVEDEKDLREAIVDVLRSKNFLPIEAKNGREGVEQALARHPDLILLDLLLPEIDGMTALKQIRKDEWGKDVPVIILTNMNARDEQAITDIVSNKPLEYLIKSDWNIYKVMEKIERVLKNKA